MTNLQKVSVTTDDDGEIFALGGGKRSQYVVGFESDCTRRRDTRCSEHVHDHVDLRRQRVRNFFGRTVRAFLDAMRFVRRDCIDAELRSPVQVQAHGETTRLVFGDQGSNHVGETAHGVDRSSVGVGRMTRAARRTHETTGWHRRGEAMAHSWSPSCQSALTCKP